MKSKFLNLIFFRPGMRMWSALLSGTNLRERGVKMICAGKITSVHMNHEKKMKN